jgi:hypothetical protein
MRLIGKPLGLAGLARLAEPFPFQHRPLDHSDPLLVPRGAIELRQPRFEASHPGLGEPAPRHGQGLVHPGNALTVVANGILLGHLPGAGLAQLHLGVRQ